MKLLPILAAVCLMPTAWAGRPDAPSEVNTAPTGMVSVASKGQDVRSVLFDLFSQANKSFVLEPNIRYVLYLNLKEVEFEEALAIILKSAGLKTEKENGITYISKRSEGEPMPKAAAPAQPAAKPKPAGKISNEELLKKVTTRLSITELRAVFAEFSKQTGLKIEIGKGVPDVKIDAFLIDTSVKFALDSVCEAVGLKYTLTENKSILIEKK